MKKIISLILCGVCAFAATAFVGCKKNSSNAESTSEETETLDIFDGNFTAITLAELQAFAANIVYTSDGFEVVKEIVANNEGVEFSVKDKDPEGGRDGYECTGKVLNGKGEFFYQGYAQKLETGDYTIWDATYETYCDGETVYEKRTIGETVEKIKREGDVRYGLDLLGIEEIPDLKEWTEQAGGVTYEYYLDETDASYNKVKTIIKIRTEDFLQTRERDITILYAFNKAYKMQAFSFVCKEVSTWVLGATAGEKSTWNTEYIARPWSGEIQAPEDLSTYPTETR